MLCHLFLGYCSKFVITKFVWLKAIISMLSMDNIEEVRSIFSEIATKTLSVPSVFGDISQQNLLKWKIIILPNWLLFFLNRIKCLHLFSPHFPTTLIFRYFPIFAILIILVTFSNGILYNLVLRILNGFYFLWRIIACIGSRFPMASIFRYFPIFDILTILATFCQGNR